MKMHNLQNARVVSFSATPDEKEWMNTVPLLAWCMMNMLID